MKKFLILFTFLATLLEANYALAEETKEQLGHNPTQASIASPEPQKTTQTNSQGQAAPSESKASEPELPQTNSSAGSTAQPNGLLPATSDHSNNGEFYSTDLVEGDPKAKVVVIEYFALTCPHCAYFHKNVYPELKAKYIDTNKIAFIHREFVGSKQDMEAAVLARCAGPMKKKAFYDTLLEQQESWAFNRNYSQILTNIGQLGGVSPEQYQTCLKDEQLATLLMHNTKLIGRTAGFMGTPAFIINNKIYPGIATFEAFAKIIDPLLK